MTEILGEQSRIEPNPHLTETSEFLLRVFRWLWAGATLFGQTARGPLFSKGGVAIRGLAGYARRHRGIFAKGLAAALFVVAARLALPWPLRAVAGRWVQGSETGHDGLIALVPTWIDPVLAMGAVFFLIVMMLGIFDALERLYFARFSIGVVHDLRADAFRSVTGARIQDKDVPMDDLVDGGADDSDPTKRTGDMIARLLGNLADRGSNERKPVKRIGDMIARLIGDTARVKNGLQSFFVHVATNGIALFGVTVVLFVVDTYLGVTFALAELALGLVVIWAANRMFRSSLNQRKKEGRLAEQIRKALKSKHNLNRFTKLNRSSGHHEAKQAKTQGTATFFAHGLFGAAVLAALWIGVRGADAGRVAPEDIVLFMMYALMMRGPFVRLARQGARTGKILGTAYRVLKIVRRGRPAHAHE